MKPLDIASYRSAKEYREAVADQTINSPDRSIIDNADGELVMKLQAEWWDSNRLEFSMGFEEDSPDHWDAIMAAKRRDMEEWMADQIRNRIVA